MVGMLIWKEPQAGKRDKTVMVKERSILHVRFLCAEVLRGPKTPETILRRRAAAAMKRLRKQGVSQMVLPEGFPFGQQLEKDFDLVPEPDSKFKRARSLARERR